MEGQIVVILIVAVFAALVFLWARRTVAAGDRVVLPVPKDPPAVQPGGPLAGLGVGATVSHDGHEYVVRGEIRLAQEGSEWTEFHLGGGSDGKTWLSVDFSHGASLAFWHGVAAPRDLEPGRGSVTHDGRTYKKVESGKAAFTTAGTTGLPPSGTARYADYAADDGQMLGFERWSRDGAWEVSIGNQIAAHQLKIRSARATARGAA